MDQPAPSRKQEIVTIVTILIIAVIVVGAVAIAKKPASSSMRPVVSREQSSAVASNATYKDGTYSASGSYDSPGGHETIKISVTLKDNVVTDTTATSGAIDPEGELYQSMFIGGYKQKVVGKKISSVSLSRVSGSSLTSQGFNNALEQIKQQAAA